MAKSKHYQLDSVFSKAIPLVREKGYSACNMDKLIKDTGFNRRAFYLEFSNKEGFFEALLSYYIHTCLLPLCDTLFDSKDYIENIYSYFYNYQQFLEQGPCLLLKLQSELGSENEQINRCVHDYYDYLEQNFIAVLERYQNQHQNNSLDVEYLALQIVFLTQNLALCVNFPDAQKDTSMLLNKLLT